MTKTNSKISSKILLIVLSILLLLSSFLFAGCGESEELGMSLISPFKVAYAKGDELDLTGGQLSYRYESDGKVLSGKISISDAYVEDANSDTTKNRITITEFNTGSKTDATMVLHFYPAGSSVQIFELGIKYRVFETAKELQGSQAVVKALNGINGVLQNILVPLCTVIASVGVIFAVFLGIKMARANGAEQRDEAKKRVVYAVVAIAISLALIAIFTIFSRFSITWFAGGNFFRTDFSSLIK